MILCILTQPVSGRGSWTQVGLRAFAPGPHETYLPVKHSGTQRADRIGPSFRHKLPIEPFYLGRVSKKPLCVRACVCVSLCV